MPDVTISADAHAAIRSMAELPFRDTARRNPNGTYTVPLSADVIARLLARRYPGETISDTIIRAAAYKQTNGRAQ